MAAARHLASVAVLALACAQAGAAEPWPEVKPPAGAQRQEVAGDMILNGRPSRVYRFEMPGSEKELLAYFREQFGAKKVVENRVKNEPVIATRQGEFFHTVQLRALPGSAMQATVMTTRLSAKPVVTGVALDTSKALPPDTKVVTTMQSDDAGKRSLMLIAVNQISTRANRDHMLNAMQQRGFRLVREDAPPEGAERSVALTLASDTEEASVAISDAGGYRTVLINRLKEPR